MCRHRFIPVHEREIIYVYVNWLFAETHDFSTLQKRNEVSANYLDVDNPCFGIL